MNARIADNVGTLKLKMLVMESIKKFPRGINSDQVISLTLADGCNGSVHLVRASSVKLQASSFRTNLFKLQAASVKPQAASFKRQATSGKLSDPGTTVHGYWRSFRGARTKGLC